MSSSLISVTVDLRISRSFQQVTVDVDFVRIWESDRGWGRAFPHIESSKIRFSDLLQINHFLIKFLASLCHLPRDSFPISTDHLGSGLYLSREVYL